jgi:hypothetical protein
MPVAIEPRPYGPDCSAEERAALAERVTLVAEDVVLLREVPVQSRFQLDLFWDRIGKLVAGRSPFFLLIDLTEARRPSAEVRAHLGHLFATRPQAKHTAVFVGSNLLLRVAARFVLAAAGLERFSIHGGRAEALAAIDRARGTEAGGARG